MYVYEVFNETNWYTFQSIRCNSIEIVCKKMSKIILTQFLSYKLIFIWLDYKWMQSLKIHFSYIKTLDTIYMRKTYRYTIAFKFLHGKQKL